MRLSVATPRVDPPLVPRPPKAPRHADARFSRSPPHRSDILNGVRPTSSIFIPESFAICSCSITSLDDDIPCRDSRHPLSLNTPPLSVLVGSNKIATIEEYQTLPSNFQRVLFFDCYKPSAKISLPTSSLHPHGKQDSSVALSILVESATPANVKKRAVLSKREEQLPPPANSILTRTVTLRVVSSNIKPQREQRA